MAKNVQYWRANCRKIGEKQVAVFHTNAALQSVTGKSFTAEESNDMIINKLSIEIIIQKGLCTFSIWKYDICHLFDE